MFGGGKRNSQPFNVEGLDVVEGNDIEILKTSDYSEGVPGSAIDELVAEHELPPAELNLPTGGDIPLPQLDEPSDEPDEMAEGVPPDNYLLGELGTGRKQRAIQTSKAAMQYWSEGMMKYRPRSRRPSTDGANANQFNYFDVLRDEPMLRKIELQRPGMSIEHLNLNRFIHNSLKGKLISEYVLRSMKQIQEQSDNGVIPIYGTASGSDMREAHGRNLRDLFNAYEAGSATEEERAPGSAQNNFDTSDLPINELLSEVDEVLSHFEEMFEHKEEENEESYTRWLLSMAEEADATVDILWMLVEDQNPDVRFCLAENYNLDATMLEKLSEDENPYVAHRAQKTLMRMQSPAGKVVDRDFGGSENRIRKSG